MTMLSQHSSRRLARLLAVAGRAVVGLLGAGAAHAADGPRPHPRDANGNLTNVVTSDSVGANCVAGTEPGCFDTVVRLVPVVGDDEMAAVGAAVSAPLALGGVVLHRRRAPPGRTA